MLRAFSVGDVLWFVRDVLTDDRNDSVGEAV